MAQAQMVWYKDHSALLPVEVRELGLKYLLAIGFANFCSRYSVASSSTAFPTLSPTPHECRLLVLVLAQTATRKMMKVQIFLTQNFRAVLMKKSHIHLYIISLFFVGFHTHLAAGMVAVSQSPAAIGILKLSVSL